LRLLTLAFAIAAALLGIGPAASQGYPNRPIRLIVPYPPGGTADAVGRMLAEQMARELGQNVVVDNRSGSGGMIGADAVAKSPPDGYTLLLGLNGPISINPAIRTSMPYDPLRDFVPVTLICEIPGLLGVPATLPVHSIGDLVAMERQHPGSVSFASMGTGTTGHLSGELLNVLTSTRTTHVPYRGTSQAMGDLLSGRVQYTFDLPTVLIPQQQAGTLRIIATASPRRLPELPDVPTVAEQGYPTLVYSAWVGMLAPAGTSREVAQRLHDANRRILANPDTQRRLASFGAQPGGLGLDEYRTYLAAEIAKWKEVAQRAHVVTD
jgi:tripartite-type tricarboxylate transporter receptor subunit TctC